MCVTQGTQIVKFPLPQGSNTLATLPQGSNPLPATLPQGGNPLSATRPQGSNPSPAHACGLYLTVAPTGESLTSHFSTQVLFAGLAPKLLSCLRVEGGDFQIMML